MSSTERRIDIGDITHMKMKCSYCYQEVEIGVLPFHEALCKEAKRVFGQTASGVNVFIISSLMSTSRKGVKRSVLESLKLEKPKASGSAFVFFGKENRSILQEQHPEASFGQISSMLSAKWRNLSDEERQYYEELSLFDKCRYQEEKREYKSTFYRKLIDGIHNDLIDVSAIDQTMLLEQKQPRGPSVFFFKYFSPMLHGKCDMETMQKALSVMWNALNRSQRLPFEQMASDDMSRVRDDRIRRQEILLLLSKHDSNPSE